MEEHIPPKGEQMIFGMKHLYVGSNKETDTMYTLVAYSTILLGVTAPY